MISHEDVTEARKRLAPYLKPSPLIHSNHLSHRFGKEIYLKLENLQDTGSFKIRGALNHMLCLPERVRRKGVVAASAGNHAQGVAWAAKQLNISATVFMPHFASIAKLLATCSYGAQVLQAGDTFDEAAKAAEERLSREEGAFIPAFNDPYVIAGQGTVGLEILEQLPEVDSVIVPAGGGGLIAGVALSLKSTRPDIEKLVYAFGWITAGIIERAKHDIDAAAAIKDQQTLVKHQLKMEVMNHARGIFQECHILATGRKAWDE